MFDYSSREILGEIKVIWHTIPQAKAVKQLLMSKTITFCILRADGNKAVISIAELSFNLVQSLRK